MCTVHGVYAVKEVCAEFKKEMQFVNKYVQIENVVHLLSMLSLVCVIC